LHDGAVEIIAQTFNPPPVFTWSNGAHTPSISGVGPGTYTVTISDAHNCTVDTSVTIRTDTSFIIIAYPSDTTIDLGASVPISVLSSGDSIASIYWQPTAGLSCFDCVSPVASPVQTTYYVATVTSDSGCVASGYVNITVIPKHVIFIPDVFTPNGDGNNDYFEVYGNKAAWKQFEVKIFDRIGEKVYESNDMNFKWDGTFKGKPCNPAVFVYLIDVVYIDDVPDKLYKGSITLLR
jgi:gliding motility-associated-like protein